MVWSMKEKGWVRKRKLIGDECVHYLTVVMISRVYHVVSNLQSYTLKTFIEYQLYLNKAIFKKREDFVSSKFNVQSTSEMNSK